MLLFSFPLSRENSRGQRKVGSFLLFLHTPPKYLFWRNEDFDRASHSNSKHSLVHIPVVCEKDRPPLPSPPPPRFESKTIPRFACLALEDALCPSRFQSLHSAHDRPYCIGVRASAYINKQARVCIGEFLAAPSIVLQAREAKSGP